MDSEYFFHEGTLLYFFNTFILRVIKADSFMSCKQNARFGCVALSVVMKGLFPLFYQVSCCVDDSVTFDFCRFIFKEIIEGIF